MENVKEAKKTISITKEEQAPKKSNKRFAVVLGLLVLGGAAFGLTKYVHSMHHEDTDDAQVEASISPVIPRVSGFVTEVRVADNQKVKKGDVLFVLDDRDLRIKLDQAEAALAAAQGGLHVAEATTSASKANVASSQANVSTVDAQIETAKINVWRATQDYNRYANLVKDHSITQQQYEQALAQKQTAEHQLQVLQEQKNAAARQTTAVASQSNATAEQIGVANATIKQRMADVENAKLNLSYATIVAPEDGVISKVNVQSGQFVQAGQTMFSIVMDKPMWVVANFKETQLDKMKMGQKVLVHVDAFPGHELEAKVTSFSPATGAKFALLPPDNASGNFVKVVQRVPVKIEFTNPADKTVKQLRPGMNVNVDVHLD
ncbi:HlyD family secretion protein [Polluticoccus soli]|uniref:HlyD family secretion protein n=1 Tax=Polluticoccus soli TaxID=3034150 RepID=UPI0023E0FF0C|nr:HlyD family secretion protein [Flavipsychrobacter sp. JY13-12]